MVDQVIVELGDAGIQGAPGVARALGGRGIVGQGVELVERLAVVHMLGTHHANGVHHEGIAAGLQHGEQNGFFLLHVRQQLFVHGFQRIGQACWHIGVVAVHGFHSARHANQLWKLRAMHFVVAGQDVVYQFGTGEVMPRQVVLRCSCDSSPRMASDVQRFLCSRLAQADLAAAAKVQLQTAKNGSGTWQLHSDLTDGLLCAQRSGWVSCRRAFMGSSLKIHLV
jgi:hypothetical protein